MWKDALQDAWKVHVAARIVRVPPGDIPSVAKHTAVNSGAALFAALLLLIANQLFYSAQSIGPLLSIIVTAISAVFILFLGFLVNLVTPADQNFTGQAASALPNKWATYMFVTFILTILVFILINCIFFAFGISLLRIVYRELGTTSERALLIMALGSAVIAVAIVLIKCIVLKQIKRGRKAAVSTALLVGAVVDGLLFRYLAFP